MDEELDDFLERVDKVSKEISKIAKGNDDANKEPEIVLNADEDGSQFRKLRNERIQSDIKKERDNWWELARNYKEAFFNESEEQEERKVKKPYDPINVEKWDKWVKDPDDPVSQKEKEELQQKKEQAENDAFEKANPDFCNMVKADVEARRKNQEKKQLSVEELKEKEYYMKAIEVDPYVVTILTNISLTHYKLNNLEQSLDFAKRALFLDEKNEKGMYREAVALKDLGNLEEAKSILKNLLTSVNPKNESALLLLHEIELEISRTEDDERVQNLVSETISSKKINLYGGFKAAVGTLLDNNSNKQQKDLAYDAIKETLNIDKDMKIYFRCSGLLHSLSQYLLDLSVDTKNFDENIENISSLIYIMGLAIEDEYNNVLLIDNGVHDLIINCIMSPVSSKITTECCFYLLASAKHIQFWNQIKNNSKAIFQSLFELLDDEIDSTELYYILLFIDYLETSPIYKENIKKFPNLTFQIFLLLSKINTLEFTEIITKEKLRSEIFEILVKLTFEPEGRNTFNKYPTRIIKLILDNIQNEEVPINTKGNALSSLANGLLDCMNMVSALDQYNALEILLNLLKNTEINLDVSYRVITCIARILVTPSFQKKINTLNNCQMFLKLLCENRNNKQFIDPIIRIFAAIINNNPCLEYITNNGMKELLSLLKGVENDGKTFCKLYGNLCRILITLQNNSAVNKTFFEADIMNELVVLIKSTDNPKVRQNAVICLSKMSKYPPALDVMKKTDIIKIVLELGKDIA